MASGAGAESAVFHEAYHPYIAAVWAYRVAVREELEGQSLTPAAFGWATWDAKDRCPCAGRRPRRALEQRAVGPDKCRGRRPYA